MSATAQIGFDGAEKDLFRIGEVSRLTNTKQFVLRYWETEFPMLKPVKSPKGHRLYRREDVDTVLRIKRLLYDEGFTIAGARRHLADQPFEPALRETVPGESASELHAEASSVVEPPAASESQESDGYAPVEPSLPLQAAMAPSDEYVVLERQKLLDLRDSLRSFLTLLESE